MKEAFPSRKKFIQHPARNDYKRREHHGPYREEDSRSQEHISRNRKSKRNVGHDN